MKKIFVTGAMSILTVCVIAQVDINRKRVRTDSVRVNRQKGTAGHQPISNQPFSNPPTPSPMTNPTNNPTNNQTEPPPIYNPPISTPPVNSEPVKPVRVDTTSTPQKKKPF